MKKLSVIMPVYKAEEYIYRAVDSVLNQTYANLELILVDDYSGNLKEWESEGGIGIQFSRDLTKDKGFPIIDKLDKIIDMF